MRSFGPKQRTRTDHRVAMTQFLYGCRDEGLAKVTVEQLVQWYKLPVAEVSAALDKARADRGVAA